MRATERRRFISLLASHMIVGGKLTSEIMANSSTLVTRRIGVLKSTVSLVSNNSNLIYDRDYFENFVIQSQWANFELRNIDSEISTDAYFYVFDHVGIHSTVVIQPYQVIALGNFSALEKTTADNRYSLFGNQGLLFRFILTLLERKYGIYSCHACGLYDEDEKKIYLVLGEKGAGKSALLFAALETGRFKVFSTEIVHFSMSDEGVVFYRGSLRNNARIGHLKFDFPELAKKIGAVIPEVPDPWGTKFQVTFEKFKTKREKIVDPQIVVVIPRMEKELSQPQISVSKNMRKLKRALFEIISDKIVSQGLIYEDIPIGSLDDSTLLKNRENFVENFVNQGRILKVVNLFASPRNCLEGLR